MHVTDMNHALLCTAVLPVAVCLVAALTPFSRPLFSFVQSPFRERGFVTSKSGSGTRTIFWPFPATADAACASDPTSATEQIMQQCNDRCSCLSIYRGMMAQ